MELSIIDNKGSKQGSAMLDDALLETKASPVVLHEIVVAHLAAQRSGTHKTKSRSEVSGGGIKPWRQKGTGRARAGSIRSPLWRKGGIIFGPDPRDYTQSLPKKKKAVAFRMAFRGLIEDERLQVVSPIVLKEPKTKNVVEIYKKWKAPTDSLLVVDKIDSNLNRGARNVADVKLKDAASLNAYDCLKARKIFITEEGLKVIVERIKK